MKPLMSDRNFMPTFTGELLTKGVEGAAAALQIEIVDGADDGEMLIEHEAVVELFNESTIFGV